MHLPDDLYQYQKEDYQRILNTEGNVCLFSSMGTGKTPVALAVSQLGNFGKTLIVSPKTIQLEWARQIKDWCGIEASVAGRYPDLKLTPIFNEMRGLKEESPFFIINYETFRVKRHLEVLKCLPFDLVLLDEAHKIRNPKAKMTKGLMEFLNTVDAQKIVAITGSPIINNPADLHTVLCIVKPQDFSIKGRNLFIERYCYYRHTRYGIKILGTRNMELLKEITAPYTIRRTKKEVLPFLPDKYVRRVMLNMNGDQKKLYDKIEAGLFILLDSGEPLHAPSVLGELMRLRQLNLDPHILGISAESSKTEFIKDVVEESSGKVVIFSCFESYVRYLSQVVFSDVKHVVITGQVKMEDRAKAVKSFQEDDSVKLALGTIQSMGEGITLTAASDVILADRWWNPAINSQAVDRLHRISQRNAVQIIIPVNENTVDQSLDTILEMKEKLSSAYLGDTNVIEEVLDDLRRNKREEVHDEYSYMRGAR
jgi:SNF2 family DNA or RNA helicase